MCVCVYIIKKACVYICVGGCFDKYLNAATWLPKQKFLTLSTHVAFVKRFFYFSG